MDTATPKIIKPMLAESIPGMATMPPKVWQDLGEGSFREFESWEGRSQGLHALPFPMLATPKLDGIRCLHHPDLGIVSRKLEPIPNRFIRESLALMVPAGFDGEIIVGDNFQECTSGVMSEEGEPDFFFWVLDWIAPQGVEGLAYSFRLERIAKWLSRASAMSAALVPATEVRTVEEVLALELEALKLGLEGLCLRIPNGPYKFGRSTVKEGYLLKLKRFADSEAEILGFEEQMRNANALEKDALGYAKRSHAKAGKIGKGTLGKFLVRDIYTGIEFKIGTGDGLTDALRKEIWDNRDAWIGRLIKYKFQPHGVKTAPRLPVFLGRRDERDLG